MKILILICFFIFPACCFSQTPPDLTKAVSTIKYDSIRNFREGFAAVCLNKKWGFIDRRGQTVIAAAYKKVSDFFEGEAVVLTDRWYTIDTSGKIRGTASLLKADRFLLSSRPHHHDEQIKRELKTVVIPLNNSILNRPAAVGVCPPNLDFELGTFANWYCFTGITDVAGGVNVIIMSNNNPPVNSPTANRHTMITASTPSLTDPYGGFPINPPDGSGRAIRLGNDQVNSLAERVRYVLQVPANATDYSITFQYAVVLENPNNGTPHTPAEKPRMTVRVSNAATGTIVQCSDFIFVAAGTIPGFFNSPIDVNVKCKSWTPVFLNLSAFAGQTLNIDFTTADCTLGAHFGYGYIDIGPCNTSIDITNQCGTPNTATLTGPPGFQQYNWWNNSYTSIVGTTRVLALNPAPPAGTTYHLEVIPFNGAVCKDTLSATLTASGPTVDAGLDKTICRQGSIGIGTAALAGNTYQWFPTTGLSNPNVATPIASPATNTEYIVTMTDAGGCIDTDTVLVNLTPYPAALFSTLTPGQCINGNNFTFQNNTVFPAGTFTSSWDFGDGTFSSVANPTHQYSLPGLYSIKLITSGSLGCGDSTTRTVEVYEKPAVVFSIPNPAQCITGNSFSFQNNSSISTGNLSYSWDFGDGSSSQLPTPVHSYAATGTYTVKLRVTGPHGCIDSLSNTLEVLPNPQAGFGIAAPVQCAGNNLFSFSDQSLFTGNNATYNWDFGDGGTSLLVNPTHVYILPNTYSVKLTVTTSTGCISNFERTVTVNPKPTVLFSLNAASQCLKGNTVSMTNNSSVTPGTLLYTWTFGDGTGSTLTHPVHVYTAAGTYPIKLVATSGVGCKDSLTQNAVINPNPVISIAASTGTTICLGGSSTLTASGAGSYQWIPAQTLSCNNCPDPIATPSDNTMYIVTGVNSFNCPDDDTIIIKVKKPFDIQAAGDTLCAGDTILLSVSGAFAYTWSPAAGLSNTTSANPQAFPIATTNYTIVGHDDANCFTDTINVNIVVRPTPTVSLGGDLVLATGETHQLTPQFTNGPITSWLWTPIKWLSCDNCPSPIASINNDINYSLKVTNIYGCAARASVKIKTICKDAQVYIPNAFTPDGDGINDLFMIRAKGITNIRYLRIFNRWGELVFERTDFAPNTKANGWNGLIKGIKGPPDVYVYTTEVVCANGTAYFYKGNVSVLK